MWAIRRASIHLKSRGLNSGTSRVRYVNSEIANCLIENCNAETVESQGKVLDSTMCSRRFCNTSVPSKSHLKAHTFCSQAGAEHHDIFHVLQARQDAAEDAASGDEMDDESIFESELTLGESFADYTRNELEISGADEADAGKEKTRKIKAPSGMTKAILADTRLPVSRALEKWVEAGNEVTLAEVSANILHFRKRRMFSQALQLSEWLDSRKLTELTESNYASRVDLIAKVRGIVEAEKYIQEIIPESLRTEVVYRTLLAACVTAIDVNKAEELFNKMKDLFPISCFSCDQLLLLYKRTNRKKIADVLSLMKRENIKRSAFTYKILIDAKWQSGHISGMERLLEEMKSDGLEPSMHILASVAKSYVDSGLKVKAEAVLKDMEGGDLAENRWACRFLLPIYGSLGRAEEVVRIWRKCESNSDMAECIAGIQAWGRLNRIEDAEAAFSKLLRIVRRPSSKHYALMLNMYADNKMLDKGEELVRQMTESGVTVTPPAWHALVKLYARGGEVGKAESILQKALRDRRGMHLLGSFLSILDAYAGKGDVENAERIFLKMKRTGFTSSARPYRSLLYAYINAKAPAYGLRERMKADNVIPDQKLAALLARASKFTAAAVAAKSLP
ncbi:pentatricopeptide repeat-containing protein At1g80270, mitochondrial-like [Salvia miltiorrhiza]|uniref:pentatricopeptide repeat-containing protein At1g80270, mitochondrial-like n=1 Tax=Salvia miltiorrhiza TaxID=226208 RepID=UPI0025AD0DEF|nr:pentatricopeptide repeat-containing protein At1g80270, mitochondrial-like [Salvia miltiorrhiza]